MKPRMRYRHGVWSCIAIEAGRLVMGFGYTTDAAWRDFLDQKGKTHDRCDR